MSKDFYAVVSAQSSDFKGTLQAHGWFTDNEQADDYAECNGGMAIRCSAPADWIEVWRHPVYGLSVGCMADSRSDLEDRIRDRIMADDDPSDNGGYLVCVKSWHESSIEIPQSIQPIEPVHDASYARGWNDVAVMVIREATDFDADRYLSGVTDAITEYRRKEDERSQVMRANQADMQTIVQAAERIKAAGIKVIAQGGAIDFDNWKGIRRVSGPALFSDDLPF